MKKENRENTGREIRQHNVITNSRHELSAVQLDVYFMLLSRLKNNQPNQFKYSIKAKEIEDLTGRVWNYNQLKDSTEALIGKVFEIQQEDGVLQVAMLSSAKYLTGKGIIELTISEELKPYLLDLKSNYTSFQLYCVLTMSSKYAKWMYVQLSRWKDLGSKTYTLDELRILLNIKDPRGKEPEMYKQWAQVKQFILDPAMEQINNYSDLKVSYTPIKKGRSFDSVRFIIDVRSEVQTVIPYELEDFDLDAIKLKRQMNEIGIMDNAKIKKVLDSPEKRIQAFKWFYDFQMRKNTAQDIKSPSGHFIKSLDI